MLEDRLNSILDSLDNKIDEISLLITGEPETMAQDIVYEEIVYYLNSLKNRLEVILEIILSDER